MNIERPTSNEKQMQKRNSIRNNFITILTLLGLLFAADICSIHAFYRSNKAKSEDIFEREKYGIPFGAEASALAVYENLKNTLSFRVQKFPPYSKNFVCFDKLDYNFPIIIGLNPPRGKVVEENLNDFLYANLKIKMLLEEYQELQESARKFLSRQMPTSQVDTADRSLRPPSGKMSSIYQTKQNLDHASRRAIWRAPSIAGSPYGGSHILQNSNTGSLASLVAQEKTIGPDYHKLEHLSAAERGAILAVNPSTMDGERNSQLQGEQFSIGGGKTSLNIPGRAISDYSDHSQLPWIIQMLTAAMGFLSNNGKEVLFFMFMILGLVGLTAGLGRR